ncbi:SgcJ/EcaC family oxidoreductase [Micromonospora sp. NBC_01813]|uniref:SgcJ/EcaC family oxidoreductase n=1 Tax=Micromonospora sp. NBC_01813 TaxID=2975988 RepID=UPI002DDB7BB9|nr:SgcJ/EcaC family oxidoreductase [Micromonospora sp. NBC_01813]WSA08754.1 SgcJ/EcaC family oxidoreductase [Micromonospora sp. NBC_01813]
MTTSNAVATAELSAEDQTAIAALPARLVAAWAAHDPAAFAELFTEDGTMILPGLYNKGRAAIETYMAEGFASRFRGTRVTGQPIELKPLGADVAALITEGGVIAAGESELSAGAAIRASWIVVKRADQWFLAVYQNCPRDPAA